MKGFKRFQELLKLNYSASQMGFKVGAAEINRISARIKLAMAFKKLDLEGYKQDTEEAYAALFKVFLTYSAFEQFLGIYDVEFYNLDQQFPDHDYLNISQEIRNKDKQGKFFDFIDEQLDSQRLKTRVSNFRTGTNFNPANVAAAVRHVFAHGKLTPNANKSNPKVTISICNILVNFLLNFMDVEFEKSINQFYTQQEQVGFKQLKKRTSI
jgi:hypothetical protein